MCASPTCFAQYKTSSPQSSQRQQILPPLPPAMQKALDEKLQKNNPESQEELITDENSQTVSKLPPPDTLMYGGIRWIAKNSSERSEPGNILYSGKPTEIYVDELGKLHLKINRRDGYWYGVDIAADTSLGYGTYAIFTETKFDELGQNIQFEFGITPDADFDSYTLPILAIQFTRIQEQYISPLRYIVANVEQNLIRERKEKVFRPDEPYRMQGLFSTHAITWKKRSCEFASYHDHGLPTPYLAALWDFSGSPSTGLNVPEWTPSSVLRLRLWCLGSPLGDKPVEIVIKKIVFIAAK